MPKSRTGMVWVTVCAGALIAVALIVFMVQNTHTVQVHFLGLTGSTSLALMLLIAALGGVLLTLILGSARIIQLRRTLRHRESAGR
ncbi:MAG TPA: lipopolysaccharide assembly protein LapA domain-containing protein [Blastococcus sp.]|nr:lipopolysaccharide assembly protein LapA domain-containing protein [Blastococcus sp.]